MREFTQNEKLFIMRHQDTWTLSELATKFQCGWKDVLTAYEEVMKTEDYQKFTDGRRKRGGWDERYGSN